MLAQTEGILLDPVYTAKAMAGLIDHVRTGILDPASTVVFLHTGGVPALFAHASLFQRKVPGFHNSNVPGSKGQFGDSRCDLEPQAVPPRKRGIGTWTYEFGGQGALL